MLEFAKTKAANDGDVRRYEEIQDGFIKDQNIQLSDILDED